MPWAVRIGIQKQAVFLSTADAERKSMWIAAIVQILGVCYQRK